MKTSRSYFPGRIAALAAVLLAAPLVSRAIDIDLTGAKLVKHGKIDVAGATPLAPAILYKITLDVTGTANGDFETALGSGDLDQALSTNFSFINLLPVTLADLNGKLPATLASGLAIQGFPDAMLTTGEGTAVMSGNLSLKLDKHGNFTGSVSHLGFSAYVGTQLVAFTGTYTALSGTMTIAPSLASITSPQPDLMLMPNTRVVLGNDVYYSSSPGTLLSNELSPGKSKTEIFLLQNDGPATDSFVLTMPSGLPAGATVEILSGKTKITSQVAGAGYTFSNLASGAVEILKVKVTVAKNTHKGSSETVTLEAASTAAPAAVDFATYLVFVQ